MKIVEIVGVEKVTTVIGSEVGPMSVSVGVMGVEEGPKAPVSLMGELFEGAPVAPESLVGEVFGGAPVAPVSLWYVFKSPKASEEVGWEGEALELRLLILSVEEGEVSRSSGSRSGRGSRGRDDRYDYINQR